MEYVRPITTSSIPARLAIAATRLIRSGSFDGSAIWKRRMPLRATARNDSSITSSAAGTHEMKRMPVRDHAERRRGHRVAGQPDPLPRILLVEADRDGDMRARGEVAGDVADAVDASGRPAAMSGVVRPTAPHRLWLPSLIVVSTIPTLGRESVTPSPSPASRW